MKKAVIKETQPNKVVLTSSNTITVLQGLSSNTIVHIRP